MNTSSTPEIQYAYSDLDDGSRLASMTYPDGRVLHYVYASGLDDDIGRLTKLADSTGSTVQKYTYLGLDTVVARSSAHNYGNLSLSYIALDTGTVGDAGDQYIGLDRFGRVVDQRWMEARVGTFIFYITMDRYQYGYDRDGNITYKDNLVSASNSELYAYDDLNRLTDFQRGTLNGTKDGITGTAAATQSWDIDGTGNWGSITTDGVTDTRTHNAQNQVTRAEGNTLAFDANGNTTTDQSGKQFVYDAWNRLVAVKDSGGAVIISYAYDAFNHRITETPSGESANDLYYSAQNQVIEERQGGVAKVQSVGSPLSTNILIERDRDADSVNGLEQRLFVLQDANGNVTGLVMSFGGQMLERYEYDPYGHATVLKGDWTPQTNNTSVYGLNYLFQGMRRDPATGLYHMPNRDYNPTLGRWMQQDPAGYVDGMSLYQMVQGNPINKIDPSGLVVDNFSDILWWYLYGNGAPQTYGPGFLGQLQNTLGFQNAVDGIMGRIKGLVSSKPCGSSGKEVFNPPPVPVQWGSNMSIVNPLTHIALPNIGLALSINNYALTAKGSFTYSSQKDSCHKGHCKFTITYTATWTISDTFSAKGIKNTIFNLIPGTPFEVTGSFKRTFTRTFYVPPLDNPWLLLPPI